MRIILSLVFLAMAAVCAYGLLASMEPGTHVGWRIGYGLGACMFVALAVASLVFRRDRRG